MYAQTSNKSELSNARTRSTSEADLDRGGIDRVEASAGTDGQLRDIAIRFANSIHADEDRAEVLDWMTELTELRDWDECALVVGRRAVSLTRSRLTRKIVNRLASELCKAGWNNAGRGTSWASAADGIWTLAVGARIGIAERRTVSSAKRRVQSLRNLIGVPIWLVLGDGESFSRQLMAELRGQVADTSVGS